MAYWIFLYPFATLLYMIHNRKRLNEVDVSAKIGFYINGYRDDFYYWYFYFEKYFFFDSLQIFKKKKGNSSSCIEKLFSLP